MTPGRYSACNDKDKDSLRLCMELYNRLNPINDHFNHLFSATFRVEVIRFWFNIWML